MDENAVKDFFTHLEQHMKEACQHEERTEWRVRMYTSDGAVITNKVEVPSDWDREKIGLAFGQTIGASALFAIVDENEHHHFVFSAAVSRFTVHMLDEPIY